MAILHGSWIFHEQRFFVWGETWRRLEANEFPPLVPPGPYPYGLTQTELIELLRPYAQTPGRATPDESVVMQLPAHLFAADEIGVLTPSKRRPSRNQGGIKAKGQYKKAKSEESWRSQAVGLPTQQADTTLIPRLSTTAEASVAASAESTPMADPVATSELTLFPWMVTGLWLTPREAFALLKSLPLGDSSNGLSLIGPDLRFWAHVTRWALDLMARSKFLPTVEQAPEGAIAIWQPLLDSAVDQQRLRQYALHMPEVCRTYQRQQIPKASEFPKLDCPPPASTLLVNFLAALLNQDIRATAQSQPFPPSTPLGNELPLRDWLQALAAEDVQFASNLTATLRLKEALSTWTAPLQNLQAGQTAAFCAAFCLNPPPQGQLDWTLSYGLQATDDPKFWVGAGVIWQHPVDSLTQGDRVIDTPQETLLAGLGRAARLYEPIAASLDQQQPQACSLNPVQAYEFIKSTAWKLQDSGFGTVLPPSLVDQTGDWADRLGLSVRAEAPSRKQRKSLGLKSLLNFKWELTIGGETLSKADFERLVALKTPLVEINGKWVELRPQDIKAAQDFFGSRKQQTNLSIEDALRISTGDAQTIEKLPVVSFEAAGALDELITTLTTGNQALEPLSEPDGFKGALRPYQARGVSWLAFLEQWGLGACLADDMGLGKTIQLIAFLLHLKQQDLLEQPILLVCPTSVLGNWDREVRRFAPPLKTLIYHGDKRPHGSAFERAVTAVNLMITSYALVQRDLKDLKRVDWQGIVLDEAQNIKNPEAKQSQAVRDIDAQFRIALTGTPVENRLSELWSILDFLNPGYLGPRNFFQRRFATPIERYGDTASLKTLRSLVQPFILRRLKTDRSIIQDLPEKQEMSVFCGLTAEQASLYQKLVDDSLATIDDAEGVQRRGLILGLLVKLKQVCNHPAHFLQQKSLGKRDRSGKLQRLDEMLEELLSEGDRALIFTQFAEWGTLLKTHLERQLSAETLFLYGSTSQKQRDAMVDRFQHDPNGPRLFILSLKAGGVGLNLTRANHVFHFDRWWNPAVENQATDRAFRIGQTRNVQVHKFVCTGTLEERIHELIESKKALSEQVVGTGERWLTELDADQLRNLLMLDRSAVIQDA
ncbi:MAG: DEAD/DEAH box helicase [Cyanobacteria bacterium J06639_16]